MTQLGFEFEAATIATQSESDAVALPEPQTIDERFAEWLEANPEMLRVFREAARKLRDRGYQRYSAKGIVEWMRFNHAIETTRTDAWKINNNFTSRLARRLIEEDAGWAEFFETRALKTRGSDDD